AAHRRAAPQGRSRHADGRDRDRRLVERLFGGAERRADAGVEQPGAHLPERLLGPEPGSGLDGPRPPAGGAAWARVPEEGARAPPVGGDDPRLAGEQEPGQTLTGARPGAGVDATASR